MDERSTRTDSGDPGSRSTALPSEPNPPPPESEVDALVGERLDRYRVEARRGAGGMGVVYTAYDPALDRRVALKVLPVIEEHRREHFEQRLRREAQALARLAHPNVVAVYDVGVAEQSVFVAMQLVDGVSADVWLESAARTPRELVEMLVAAGRGLAAAHDAGIVHRDVKPSNVLIDAKGAVCVGDFGLARSSDEAEPTSDDGSLLDVELTRAGAAPGTPPFMAPEQHRGEPATPRSDQFSFCVMAWKALFGRHPFCAGSWHAGEAKHAMALDAVIEPPHRRGIAARVVRALRRGLRHDPDARWPSMHELVAAIAPRSYAAWWWGAGALVVGMTLAATATAYLAPTSGPPPCGDAQPAWGPFASIAVRTSVAATGRPNAGDAFARLAHALDQRTGEWLKAHDDACHQRDEQTAELFARRMLCLDRRNNETGALVDQLSRPLDGDTLDKSVAAVGKLGPIADCADGEALLGRQAPPHTPQAADLERRLDDASALDTLGKYDQGLAIVQPLVAEARDLHYTAAAAEALHETARMLDGLGKYPEAEAAAYDAITEAGRAGDDVLAARAMLLQVYITNDEEGHPDVASALARAAEGLIARVNHPQITGTLHFYRGNILYQQGKLADAREQLHQALAIFRTTTSTRLEEARVLNTLSLVDGDGGNVRDALASAQQALAIYRDELGPEHPDTFTILTNLGMIETRLGDDDHARAHYHQAIDGLERVFGRDHGQLVAPLSDLASLEADAGHLEVALPLEQRAQAITETAFGAENPRMAWILDNLGEMRRRLGRLDEAETTQRRALALAQKLFGADHPDTAYGLDDLGKVLRDRGKLTEARTSIEAGLALREKSLGADNEAVGWSLESLASVLEAQGNCAGAIPRARRAVTILEAKLGAEHRDLITGLLVIGRCAPHAEALAALQRAQAIANAGPVDPKLATDVKAALAQLR